MLGKPGQGPFPKNSRPPSSPSMPLTSRELSRDPVVVKTEPGVTTLFEPIPDPAVPVNNDDVPAGGPLLSITTGSPGEAGGGPSSEHAEAPRPGQRKSRRKR